jgi:diguanylate cyclase (GGDEF)-like protein
MYLEKNNVDSVVSFSTTDYSIKDIHLFRQISDEHLAQVAAIINQCPVIKIKQGQVVIAAQSNLSKLYIVLHGVLGVTGSVEEEQSADLIGTRYLPGECVGEISVLDEENHTATITALADSELLVIESECVWHLINESNGVARNLLQLLSFRIRAANAQIRNRQKVGEFYRQMSMIDGLTGLHNRAWLNNQLPALIDNAHLTKAPLSIVMVDLDYFKRFNDQYGHVAGDDALQTAAKVINAGIRPSDFAARYGGEEMMVILPNTNQAAALAVAERLCRKLRETTVLTHGEKSLPHVTASFGLVTVENERDVTTVIAKADAALYRAKSAGRDQVSL